MLVMLLDPSALAEARGILPGFGEFRFGMTEAELTKLVAVSRAHDQPGGTRLEIGSHIVIGGDEFALSLLTSHGTLQRISLARSVEANEKDCRLAFDRLVQEFSSRHGAPDQEPRQARDDSRVWVDVAFTFDDGARIGVTMAAGEFGTCSRFVSFQSALDATAH